MCDLEISLVVDHRHSFLFVVVIRIYQISHHNEFSHILVFLVD